MRGDMCDRPGLHLLLRGGFDAVIHFAGLKAVGESCEKPLDYFDIGGTIALLQAMHRASCTPWC